MTTVMKAFRVDPRYRTDGDLGVEVEVEGSRLPDLDKFWRTEMDGSLRGESREYVLAKPMKAEGVAEALQYLDKAYIDAGTVVHESVRAGVHVHVNVQDLTVVELFNFIVAYVVLEDLLTKYCGEYREGNLFCLRVKDADYLLHMLEKVAGNKRYELLHTDILRYAAMNVKSLHTYGSLEFRAMRGTRDLDIINNWANILLGLREASREFQSPAKLVGWIEDNGSEAFLERFLGDFLPELTKHLKEGYDITDGLVRASPLALHTDWDSFKLLDIGGLEFPLGTEFPDAPLEDF
jgi:hypothetical protein